MSFSVVVNGIVDANDALLALQSAAKLISLDEQQSANADVNEDKFIDAADALKMLQYAAKIIDEI